ncbi:MAG: CapA family protein [Candidatus Promineifilaceae bacterium]|nr:CapA family protein [Candidatus Promineifilaceae bacterium]
MKRLYIIFLLLFIVGCGRPDPQDTELSDGQTRPTIPAEWLTKPPTPVIISTALAIPQSSVPNPADTPTLRPGSQEPTATAEQDLSTLLSPSPTSEPFIAPTAVLNKQLTISAAPGVPAQLRDSARHLTETLPNDFQWLEPDQESADITFQLGNDNPIALWTYVVAAPFATIKDEISLEEVLALWSGDSTEDETLVVAQDTAVALSNIWGPPAAEVTQVSAENLRDTLWDKRPSLTIIPFEELAPDLKALRLDGHSLLDPTSALEDYPLVFSVGVSGEEQAIADFLPFWQLPTSNRDPARMTRVAMTGVTALVRATASQMETDGILTAGVDVAPILRAADITHISNEVSFAEDCPEPNPVGGTVFCSKDEYFALLEDLGTDVVELTGNHVNDWGPEAVHHTLEMYEEANIQFFGGGRDLEESAKPAIFQHNRNRIAFVGCNPVGPNYAWAGASSPGSQPCGPEFLEQIESLSAQGVTVIATQQYYEFYHYPPTSQQQEDFKELVDAGAAAVSGSQGHHAQGFEFYDGAFIHFGLGNLFFDQMDMTGTRQSFVDIYTIYDGRLINVELWTGLIEDFFQPRLMTAAERE